MPDYLSSSAEEKDKYSQFRSQSADKNQERATLSVICCETSGLKIREINIPEEYHLCSGGNCKGNSIL